MPAQSPLHVGAELGPLSQHMPVFEDGASGSQVPLQQAAEWLAGHIRDDSTLPGGLCIVAGVRTCVPVCAPHATLEMLPRTETSKLALLLPKLSTCCCGGITQLVLSSDVVRVQSRW